MVDFPAIVMLVFRNILNTKHGDLEDDGPLQRDDFYALGDSNIPNQVHFALLP